MNGYPDHVVIIVSMVIARKLAAGEQLTEREVVEFMKAVADAVDPYSYGDNAEDDSEIDKLVLAVVQP